MKVLTILLQSVLLMSALAVSGQVVYAGGHDHGGEAEAVEEKGPNGGKLLREGNIAAEITVFETGVPPEMRVFIYRDDQLLSPEEGKLSMELHRIDGQVDQISFKAEGDYLRGEQTVVEPHSYDVVVRLRVQGKAYEWKYESHEGRSLINDAMAKASGIETDIAGPQTLDITRQLFGVIEVPIDRQAGIYAPYPSVLEQIHVAIGDKVQAGQKIATLRNIKTLQRYNVKAPIGGEVVEWMASIGQRVDENSLARVVDLSKVWVEMSAFPEDIEQLALGQPVRVADMHQHEIAPGEIIYIAPQMTGGHIARARALIDNGNGHWRPGMHVKADIRTAQRDVELAVRNEALQGFRDFTVVFGRFGDQFEVRMLELGQSDGEYTEVLGGLKPGTEYATKNSFIIKADVLKDGAAHDH
ncbi:efflux RND transporter periplasmic adaptor subunit [Pseudoteredinibacter isoporae]|uniref:Cobalt-zinc-cadmium efflux system membrane fusion protein n=1 Tax=Pseudoteredinibacter isoporae TaxID=570281 RepID=A0A7X0JTT2_9GAMM|nr:efflux RND transporter periplasmic adaptor subunit [Pseudoteredinibacter isoporae]MBB6522118.1 cobalt-zinc-cadmium efflux system membrane fusion protein [Pseudoteredinibacter isoporae]NHO87653.1 HlyD family efflux transporter periplasmic adaptor subunit [Pseudoteredinibacter isoporae]NIB24016.1 HlyD family efflux transporter periplasmic adaptor subunit [Pseudoteredinibacter isoporae]